jgi:hypothetical protein
VAAKGYAAASDVALALGVASLSTLQTNQVTAWLEGVESWVEAYTGRAWLTGALTDEFYEPAGPDLYLRQRPITTVEAVKGRFRLTSTVTTLTAGSEYEVRDATRGRLWLPLWDSYDWFAISYTPAATVPAGVKLATAQLLADAIQGPAQGGSNVKAFSVFGQVSMTFRDTEVSPQVAAWLAPFRALVLA